MNNTGPDSGLPGAPPSPEPSTEVLVGIRIRELRLREGLSLRALAERSGLNINTLSLVEHGKSSPSVSTLQQAALALNVPISAFFESEPALKRIVHTSRHRRPSAHFSHARMEYLGKDLSGNAVQPFVVSLAPGDGSGERLIVHTGHEFVYCLSGNVLFAIEGEDFLLGPGDSLVFECHLPHCWKNIGEIESQIILVLYPADNREDPVSRHFSEE